jgi:type IV pilus assembly protein PilW
MQSTTSRLNGRHAQRGMTLVELMVALLLGLVTTYFISQVFAMAEGQKRTATFGTDAQVNGAVAMHNLRRHVMGAGYGLMAAPSAIGCPMFGKFGSGVSTMATPAMVLAPVVITPSTNASAPSDKVQVMTSTKSSFAAPLMLRNSHQVADEKRFEVAGGTHGVKTGDSILAVPAGWTAASKCMFFTVAEDTTNPATQLNKQQIPHVAAPSASSWNNAADSDWPTGGFPDKSLIVNFGTFRRMEFGVSADNDYQVVTWTAQGVGAAERLNSGIVLLKALYGRDTSIPADGTVDVYDTTTPTTNDGWNRVVTVRLVMVARSGQRERDVVTTAMPTWQVGGGAAVSYVASPGGAVTACAATDASCALPLDLSHVSEWQQYRYKVFETAVPLRNLMWNAEEGT